MMVRKLESSRPGTGRSFRVYRGQAGLHKLVELQIAAPAQQLVSHSLLAFTAPDSAVPHFVMDAVLAGPRASLHIDLIPRIPLEQHEAYHAHCFAPLRVVRRDMARDKRLGSGQDTAKFTGPRSPYEALCNLPTEQLEVARSYARRYFEHWCSMLGAPLPRQATAGLDRGELASRDRQTRTAIFHRDSDPFWRKLDAVVGADSVNRILQELTSSAIQTKA